MQFFLNKAQFHSFALGPNAAMKTSYLALRITARQLLHVAMLVSRLCMQRLEVFGRHPGHTY